MQVNVITLDNEQVGTINLSDAVFGLPIRSDILQRVVTWQLAKRQAGTHKTKTIGDVSGTTAKPYSQKGTGRARQGSKRSPQFRGGAVIFGPVVRSHAHKLPKKVRALGLKTALSAKQEEGSLFIIKDIALEQAKTTLLSAKFAKLDISSALIIGGAELDKNFVKAAANIPNVDLLPYQGANVYDILKHKKVLLTEAAVKYLEERLA